MFTLHLTVGIHGIPCRRVIKSRFNSISFVDINTGYACAASSRIYKTIDGGASWNLMESSSKPRFSFTLHFIDEQTGFVGNHIYGSSLYNDKASIYKTEDAGITWVETEIPELHMILKISFADQNNGWAIGGGPEYGKLIYTQNGGENWTEMIYGDDESILTMDFRIFDDNLLYILTTGNQIYKIYL